MGIGPKNTSLLSKLGFPSITEMSEAELRALVSGDRQRRAVTRAAGRINRIAKDRASKPKVQKTLESTGLAADLILKLRSTGKSDAELLAQLKAGGII